MSSVFIEDLREPPESLTGLKEVVSLIKGD